LRSPSGVRVGQQPAYRVRPLGVGEGLNVDSVWYEVTLSCKRVIRMP
jgi:hypothetical protein